METDAQTASPTAAVTVTLEGAQKGGLAGMDVLSEVLLFYLNLANCAGRRWGMKTPVLTQVCLY